MEHIWSDEVGRIARLFERHGATSYEGARHEPVTALAHALQCAQLAEWAHAEPALVAAALLHDIGHFVADESSVQPLAGDDRHEHRGADWLDGLFGEGVGEPVRLHVEAKRYLVRVDLGYAESLSPASRHSLGLQGGAMSPAQAAVFETRPHAREAVMLRRWDDLAKLPRKRTPPLAYYLALLEDLRQSGAPRTRIGATDLA